MNFSRWGCTHNTSDSEYMAGQLASYGYTLVGKIVHFYPTIGMNPSLSFRQFK